MQFVFLQFKYSLLSKACVDSVFEPFSFPNKDFFMNSNFEKDTSARYLKLLLSD